MRPFLEWYSNYNVSTFVLSGLRRGLTVTTNGIDRPPSGCGCPLQHVNHHGRISLGVTHQTVGQSGKRCLGAARLGLCSPWLIESHKRQVKAILGTRRPILTGNGNNPLRQDVFLTSCAYATHYATQNNSYRFWSITTKQKNKAKQNSKKKS